MAAARTSRQFGTMEREEISAGRTAMSYFAPTSALSSWRRPVLVFLGCFTVVMFALHWVHLSADPSWKMGFLTGKDWAGDFFTDEGWEAKAAIRAVLLGDWHAPGEINLAVESPLWPAILYLPFKMFGVSIGLARGIAMMFYAGSVGAAFAFVKRLSGTGDAVLVAALLSVNVLGFTFGRAALIEPVFICFVVLALLLALYASDYDSIALSLLAGGLLSLAILVKLTAVSAIVPLVAILWLRFPKGNKRRAVAIVAALTSVAILPLLQRYLLIARYPIEAQGYLQMNVVERKVSSLHQWLVAMAHILFGFRAVGPFLLLSFLIGTALYVVLRYKNFRNEVLFTLSWIWLLANIAIFSTVRYFPPRYCLSLLFPLTFLAVHYARAVSRSRPRTGLALYALLALSLVADGAQDLWSLAHPRYTMAGLAEEVKRSIPQGEQTSSCPIMSFMGDTISLYNSLPATNFEWDTGLRWQRIQACNPSVFITRDAVDHETQQDFLKAGKVLEFRMTYRALAGHYGDQPEQVYVVKPLKPAP